MQGKSNLIRITPALAGGARERKPFFIVLFILSLAIATPVLADYLGPHRTITETTSVCKVVLYECQYVASKDLWKYKQVDDWSCSNEGKPWQAYPDTPSSQGCFDDTVGDQYWGKEETLQTITITHPEATIASALQGCNLNNGWCNTASVLSLNGTEPLSGYSILAVEGSLNGQTFACSGGNCTVSLNEGSNDFSFWALSSWGDSSSMGTFSAKVDTVSPTLGLDITATNGANGWYISPATITATGSDSTSGLSSVFLWVDNGAWIPSATLNEGVYNVLVQAEDNAGNVAQSSTVISVDTTTPTIDVSVNGTLGSNGWYSSSMEVSAAASDATSGVDRLEMSADGGAWTAVSAPVSFADGYHTVQFKAADQAGNETETSMQEFYVDTIAPAVDLPVEWEVNDTITYKVQDDGSGLSALRIVIEDEDEKYAKVAWDEVVSGNKFKGEITWDGKFKDGTVAPPGEYLVWVKVTDTAGNERIGLGRVTVPQPFASFSLIQPSKSSTEVPTPPADLFVPKDSSPTTENFNPTPSSSTSFGGSTSPTNSTTVQSLSFSSGTASASATTSSNVLWGATAAALIGWATATALEEKKRKALHRASRDEAEALRQAESAARKRANTASHQANRDEEPPLTRQEKELAKKRKELQKIWDANGAAIYEANREYKTKHGRDMDAATRSKAIKDATVNGVFHAGTYASTLEAEKTRQDAQNERMANKMMRVEQEEEVRWQASQKAAEGKRKADELQAGYAAYYAAMRQGEQAGAPKVLAAPPPPPPTLTWLEKLQAGWEEAKQWVNTNVIQPAKDAVKKTITTLKNFVTTTVTTVKETYQDIKNDVKQKWEDTKQWVNTKIVQPAINFYNDPVLTIENWIDNKLDETYDYHGPINAPTNVTGQIWSALPNAMPASPNLTFNTYFVTQNPPDWPSPNECVTAATIQSMNMIQDILTSMHGIPSIPHQDLPSFAATDSFWQSGRPPADVQKIGGMLLPQSAVNVLNTHGNNLRETYGCGYTAELTSGNTVDDLIQNLQNGYPTNIHISQDVDLFDSDKSFDDYRALLGGVPHTMTIVGYDANTDKWSILDPAAYYSQLTTLELMDLWGRQFIAYPPRFAMTTLIPDAVCNPPVSPSNPYTYFP